MDFGVHFGLFVRYMWLRDFRYPVDLDTFSDICLAPLHRLHNKAHKLVDGCISTPTSRKRYFPHRIVI